MLQPFIKFEKAHLDKLISLNKIYVVSQSYKRGYNHLEEIHATDILLTDYDNPGLAIMHYNAIKNDMYGAMIDLSKGAHLAKITEMLAGSDYKLYWSVIKSVDDLQKRLDAGYKIKLRRYIEVKTTWRIPVGESLKTQFEVTFGELFLVLKWHSQRVRLKFEEIERL